MLRYTEDNMKNITCYNCEEEFNIEPIYETEALICFCPYCGSELGDDIEEDHDELDEDNWN